VLAYLSLVAILLAGSFALATPVNETVRRIPTGHGLLAISVPSDWVEVTRHGWLVAFRRPDVKGVVAFILAVDPMDGYSSLGEIETSIGHKKMSAIMVAGRLPVEIQKLSEPGNRGFFLDYQRAGPDEDGFMYRAEGSVLISHFALAFLAVYQEDAEGFVPLVLRMAQTARLGKASAERRLEKARDAYLAEDFQKAERLFSKLIEDDPDSLFENVYLGHSLYYQSKYSQAIQAYERAVALFGRSASMDLSEQRLLTDQLGMSYGLTDQKDKAVFEAGIAKDPEYPMYYYNLACTHAEMGHLNETLVNLKNAFARRQNMLPGEQFPNPRQDRSFARFLEDEQFEAVMKELGY